MKIRAMTHEDTEQILEMMRVFYTSPAVLSNGSEEIFRNDIAYCIGDNPYLEGYVFEEEAQLLGYAMIAKSFSTEFGKPCIWIEDLYIRQKAQGKGIGTAFLSYIERCYPDCIFRLEVEDENQHAVHVYQKCGYQILPYMEMKKELEAGISKYS